MKKPYLKDSFLFFHLNRHISDNEPLSHRMFFWKLYKYVPWKRGQLEPIGEDLPS